MSKTFKVGDTAWSPYVGFEKIKSGENRNYSYMHGRYFYLEDGRVQPDDKHPTLLTVEEAAKLGYFPEKKKVKKRDELWMNIYPQGFRVTHTKEQADEAAGNRRIRCLRFVSDEYEVEE